MGTEGHEPISKVKLSVGGHTFEAEGPEAAVAHRFDLWHGLVERALQAGQRPALDAPAEPGAADARAGASSSPAPPADEIPPDQLTKLFHFDERRGLVLLRIPIQETADVALTTLYAFRAMREMDEVTAVKLAEAMSQAGHGVVRLDRPLAQHIRERLIIATGQRRGRRYRLTATGLARARRILDEHLEQLP
jgi:hypothetical protein